MESVVANARESSDNRPHMGSEYMDAQTYLAQQPHLRSLGTGRKKAKSPPQHGSNDTDFGAADQTQD